MLRVILAIIIVGFATRLSWCDVRQNVVVVLDDSSSMGESMRSDRRVRKIDAAKKALLEVLDQLPPDAQVGVYALNSRSAGGTWIVPLGPIDRALQRRAIGNIQAQGGTPLGKAMQEATDELLRLRERDRYGDYQLLVVSDGEAQDQNLVNRYLPHILNRQITVDVIGVSMAQDHSLATQVDRYRRADDVESLQAAIRESMAESPLDLQDPDESADFELLEGLPDEFAVAAIQALTRMDNRPLVDSATEAPDDLAAHPSPTGRPAAHSPGRPSNRDAKGSPSLGVSKIAIFGIILVLIVIVKSTMRAATRRR